MCCPFYLYQSIEYSNQVTDDTLKYFFLNHIDTLTKAINTGTSTNGPITVVNATGDAKPNVAIATASANSKLFPAAVKEIATVLG